MVQKKKTKWNWIKLKRFRSLHSPHLLLISILTNFSASISFVVGAESEPRYIRLETFDASADQEKRRLLLGWLRNLFAIRFFPPSLGLFSLCPSSRVTFFSQELNLFWKALDSQPLSLKRSRRFEWSSAGRAKSAKKPCIALDCR